MSIPDVKQRERDRRWAEEPRPSLQNLRDAVHTLTTRGVVAFTIAQVHDQMLARGDNWSRETLRELLLLEVAKPTGSLERIRAGRYRLRPAAVRTTTRAMTAAGHVREAMQRLAATGQRHVSRRQVEDELRAGGVEYSGRAVRDGLLRLQQLPVPEVERVADGRYRLTAAGSDGAHRAQ